INRRCAISSGRSGLDSTRVSWAFTLPTLTIPLPLAEGNNRDGNSNGYRPTLVGAYLLRRPLGWRVPLISGPRKFRCFNWTIATLIPCSPITMIQCVWAERAACALAHLLHLLPDNTVPMVSGRQGFRDSSFSRPGKKGRVFSAAFP